jgi:ubiquinone/menaquinone biosynthesis C-methylase UbiE
VRRERNSVCPAEVTGALTVGLRKRLQSPEKILSPFLKEGMTVLDVGCGPGFFTVPAARMGGKTGRVVAVDLQEAMLRILVANLQRTCLEERVLPVKCESHDLSIPGGNELALVFYMVHEVPDKDRFFRQLKAALNPDAQVLLFEPKRFHVSREEFQATAAAAERAGFQAHPGPRLPFSWSAVLTKAA